jgi:PTS system nitrogen regulatory IIA component
LNDVLVSPTFIDASVSVTSKRHLLSSLAQRVSAPYGVEERDVLEALQAREQEGSTGAGDGVAIPHAKISGLTRTVTYFARLSEPVEYDSLDDEPVDLIFLILAPESANGDHLKLLARVSRAFKDAELRERLRGAEDASALDVLLNQD